MIRLFFILFSSLLLSCQCLYAQLAGSIKPRWISETPVSTNPSYRFHVTYVDNSESISGARMQSKSELYRLVEKSESIKVIEAYDMESRQRYTESSVTEKTDELYAMTIESDGEAVDLVYMKLDEYWCESIVGGIKRKELYTLYAVARPDVEPRFDDVYFTNRYGIKGMARSLVPGWGQLYKGQKVKGACIMGGEVLLIGSVIVSENLRSSYIKKMKEQPKFFQTYNSKADNWANIRNVCIGAAAALYVYNLIDAAVSPGARYAVVKKAKLPVMQPVACGDFSGISLAWYF